jgi:multiple sugar transport system permease protein
MRKDSTIDALLFLAPNLFGFLMFVSIPLLASLALSFTQWDGTGAPMFVGFENFIDLLGFHYRAGDGWAANDPLFWQYLWNTIFLMLVIPFSMVSSLVCAILLNRKIRGIKLFRVIFYLPSLCVGVALYTLWTWIYEPEHGVLNSLLSWIGIEGPQWLRSIAWSKPSLMLMGYWTSIGGGNCVLYLAALQDVDPQLYEAAAIDGANSWHRFRLITWPMVSHTTFFIAIMSMIHGLQGGFETSFVMTGGGPAGSTTTLGYYIYNKSFVSFEFGYASAIAWVMFFLILVVTMINWFVGKRREMA